MKSFSCCRCFRRKANPDSDPEDTEVETSGTRTGTSASSARSASPCHASDHQSNPDTPKSSDTASLVVGESTPLTNHPPNNQLLGHLVRPSPSISHLRLSSTSDKSHSHGSGSPLPADNLFVARDIWSTAYTSLREDSGLEPLIEKYESFFHTVLWPEDSFSRADSGLTGEKYAIYCSKICLTVL